MVQMNSTPADVLKEKNEITALPLSVNNARELGGLPLMHGRKVKRGLLLSVLDAAWHYFNTDFENPAAFLKEACGITEEELQTIRDRYIE